MQSVYKLPIAMAILTRVDNKSLTLDQKIEIKPKDYVSRREHTIALDYPKGANLSITELLDYMIAESDGTACDALLRLLGGPEAATKYVRDLKINDITIATYEADMFADPSVASQNWSTPPAMVEVLRLLQTGNVLSTNSRQLLLDLMIKSRPGPKRIKGLLPPEMQVAHKTGTSGTRNGITATTNDVGLITLPNGQHLAIAVFVSESKANLPTRESIIAKIAGAATDCWTDTSTQK
jgi:beta-lactamase class A